VPHDPLQIMTLRLAIIAVLLAFALCVALALGPYIWAFGSLRVDTTKPELWAHFGTYLSGVLGPLLAILNILAIVYIAVQLTQLQQADTASKKLSLDLYNEWHGKEMHESRIEISRSIAKFRKEKRVFPALSKIEGQSLISVIDVFRIYHFFEKWALLVQEKHVEPKLLQTLLGGYAAWWSEEYFADAMNKETDQYMASMLKTMHCCVFSKAKKPKGFADDAGKAPE
jgi:hypothetical protein